jgi:hypothetical protein
MTMPCLLEVVVSLDRPFIPCHLRFVIDELSQYQSASSKLFRAATIGFSNCFSSRD